MLPGAKAYSWHTVASSMLSKPLLSAFACQSGLSMATSLSAWRLVWVLAAVLLTACAHPDRVLRVRSLDQPYDATTDRHSNGRFQGLARTADFTRHDNLNLLFVHGIGWTQREGPQGFGFDWVDALASAYGVPSPRPDARTLCETSGQGQTVPRAQQAGGGLRLVHGRSPAYSTDDAVHRIQNRQLGCLDRIRLELGGGKSITVYRFFWDDTMWDAYQAHHLGQDDPVPVVNGTRKFTPGQEDIDTLRTPANAHLKNQLVTYGLSDAALYLGPVGAAMREGVRGAVCAAALGLDLAHAASGDPDELCQRPVQQRQPFAVMAHSLGSRIVFDTLHTDLHPDLVPVLQGAVSNYEIEVYMLANQLPLIGLGRLGHVRSPARLHPLRLRLVAVSELDDPLTYELVPYFESLYFQRCAQSRGALGAAMQPFAPCQDGGGTSFHQRVGTLAQSTAARNRLVQSLGFDVIDIRTRFAPAALPGLGWLLTDPYRAHSEYMGSLQVQQALICGVDGGRIRQAADGCALNPAAR